jgi:outer membrane murein-binding lipoprotein Lpp
VQAQVRQLAEDNQALKEKLQASRDNNRFLGKRIADLEPEVCE